MKIGIVVTGLPASGKTTLARSIAHALSFALLDKDDVLERLYAAHHVRTWDDRKALSRQSDIAFQQATEQSGSAVLVSHWKPPGSNSESGTSTDWLPSTFPTLIELYCACSADIALTRFLARSRHPGHLDTLRDPKTLADQFDALQTQYPLGIGPVVTVNTAIKPDLQALALRLQSLLNTLPS